jgi:3-deoxy-D-manno-octulosonate 8-phosphate phosphatase (KDO 8-P phosphatase)
VYKALAAADARRIRMVALDVDGVMTDNGVYIGTTSGGETVELKRFDILDGLGIGMLRRAGLIVALISGRHSEATTIRARELGVECFQAPGGRKIPAFRELLERHELSWEEVAFLADDLADLPALRRVGLPVAVANAVPEVMALARWRTTRPGGSGAVREFAETLLQARGEWAGLVEAYCRDRERPEAYDAD